MGTATVYTPVTGWNKASYCGPTQVPYAHPCQILSVFHPDETRWQKPPAGWPVFVCFNGGGMNRTHIMTSIGPLKDYVNATTPDTNVSFQYERLKLHALEYGYAVIDVATTPVYGYSSGNALTDSFDIDYTTTKLSSDYHMGNAPPGNGCYVPPEVGIGELTYFTGSVHPALDPERHNMYRDACMASQFISKNAIGMGIDRSRIIGATGSGFILAFVAGGKNHASTFWPNGTGQELLDTRIYKACVMRPWQNRWQIVDFEDIYAGHSTSTIMLPIKPTTNGTQTIGLLTDPLTETLNVDCRNYDIGSWQLSDIMPAMKNHIDALHYGQADPAVLAANRAMYWYQYSATADAPGAPFDLTQASTTTDGHTSWFMAAWHAMLGVNSRAVMEAAVSFTGESATIVVATVGCDKLYEDIFNSLVTEGGFDRPKPQYILSDLGAGL